MSERLLLKVVYRHRQPRRKDREPTKTVGCHHTFDAWSYSNDQKISLWKISLISKGVRATTSLTRLTDLPPFVLYSKVCLFKTAHRNGEPKMKVTTRGELILSYSNTKNLFIFRRNPGLQLLQWSPT